MLLRDAVPGQVLGRALQEGEQEEQLPLEEDGRLLQQVHAVISQKSCFFLPIFNLTRS